MCIYNFIFWLLFIQDVVEDYAKKFAQLKLDVILKNWQIV